MDSRRVVAALTRRRLPDRVPVQFDLSRALADRFCQKYGIRAHYTTANSKTSPTACRTTTCGWQWAAMRDRGRRPAQGLPLSCSLRTLHVCGRITPKDERIGEHRLQYGTAISSRVGTSDHRNNAPLEGKATRDPPHCRAPRRLQRARFRIDSQWRERSGQRCGLLGGYGARSQSV